MDKSRNAPRPTNRSLKWEQARRDHESGALDRMRELVHERAAGRRMASTGVPSASGAENAEKVREGKLRRMARRQGYALMKSRARDFRAIDYGRWWVADPDSDTIVAGEPVHMDIDDVEAFLADR